MRKATYSMQIETEDDRARAQKLLQGRDLPLTLTLTRGLRRSLRQNHLQWLWMSEAEAQGDHTQEEYQAYCKLHFGVPILLRDNPEFRDLWQRVMQSLAYAQQLLVMAAPWDFPVSRIMTTSQHREFLDSIYDHFVGLGFRLTDPEWGGLE
jgi:hypothetical protein